MLARQKSGGSAWCISASGLILVLDVAFLTCSCDSWIKGFSMRHEDLLPSTAIFGVSSIACTQLIPTGRVRSLDVTFNDVLPSALRLGNQIHLIGRPAPYPIVSWLIKYFWKVRGGLHMH